MTTSSSTSVPATGAAPQAGNAWTLKFISGKYQGGEFPLPSEKEVVVGRSSDLDMVLVEDMVSRKHAKFSTFGGHVTIQDLGSTNGTFVNGEKIKKARIKEGDRILIGTSILKLVAADATRPRAAMQKPNLEEVAAAQKKTLSATMTGRIEEVPLPDLLQLFGISKKHGVLYVRGEVHEARIYLREGKCYYVVIDRDPKLAPRKAFNRVITWERGSFELLPPDPQKFAEEMNESTEGLLMEALRQYDEMKKLGSRLPKNTAPLGLTMPLGPKLRELAPEELDAVQLVLNFGTLQGVLDHSAEGETETATRVADLIEKKYVRAL